MTPFLAHTEDDAYWHGEVTKLYRDRFVSDYWRMYFFSPFGCRHWSDAGYARSMEFWRPWWPWRVGARVQAAVVKRARAASQRMGAAWHVLRHGAGEDGWDSWT